MKERLDQVLPARGLARSRSQARQLIDAGAVQVNGLPAAKPSQLIAPDDRIEVLQRPRYVGRGGGKLEAALAHFRLPVIGGRFLDVGASTGGFTDCLLQHGAAFVVAVDVGHGQMDAALREDPRVSVFEGVNIRSVPDGLWAPEFDGAAIDVSFISLVLVLPHVVPWVRQGGWLVALVKPQFECGPESLDARGVVRDPMLQLQAVAKVTHILREQGCQLEEPLPSPVLGGEGTQEYLLAARRSG